MVDQNYDGFYHSCKLDKLKTPATEFFPDSMKPGTFALGRRFDFLHKETIMIQLKDSIGLVRTGNLKDRYLRIGQNVGGLPMIILHPNLGLTNFRTRIIIKEIEDD